MRLAQLGVPRDQGHGRRGEGGGGGADMAQAFTEAPPMLHLPACTQCIHTVEMMAIMFRLMHHWVDRTYSMSEEMYNEQLDMYLTSNYSSSGNHRTVVA